MSKVVVVVVGAGYDERLWLAGLTSPEVRNIGHKPREPFLLHGFQIGIERQQLGVGTGRIRTGRQRQHSRNRDGGGAGA